MYHNRLCMRVLAAILVAATFVPGCFPGAVPEPRCSDAAASRDYRASGI